MRVPVVDYRWVNDTTRPDYERVLEQYALQFLKWRAADPRRQQGKFAVLERGFRVWWNLHGPTRFRDARDTMRFKLDLLAYLQRRRAEVSE